MLAYSLIDNNTSIDIKLPKPSGVKPRLPLKYEYLTKSNTRFLNSSLSLYNNDTESCL